MREENFVGCLLLIVFLAFPRIALALLLLFSNYLERAYHSLILPLLGFLFLPLTTLVYAWMANTRQPIAGINLLILIVTIVVDLAALVAGNIIDGDGGRISQIQNLCRLHSATNPSNFFLADTFLASRCMALSYDCFVSSTFDPRCNVARPRPDALYPRFRCL
jgi:hypothetical protein